MNIAPLMPLAAVLALAVPSAHAEPAVDFDKGVDVSAVLSHAREKSSKEAVAAPSIRTQYRTERDCVTFTFHPDSPVQSEAVWLRSQEWIQECRNEPPHGGRTCYDRPGRIWRERAQVTLRERQPLYPWEHDAFTVCLEGPWLDIYARESAYEYKVVRGGRHDASYLLAPVKKLAMRPDPAGIAAGSWAQSLTLTLNDKWASYYSGEQTGLKVTLVKHVKFWPDVTIVSKEVTLPSAASYEVDFRAWSGEFSQKLEPGEKYYARYEFRRLGKISKDKWTGSAKTDDVRYQPAQAASAR